MEIEYLNKQGISYSLIDSFDNDLIAELTDFTKNCEALVNMPEQKPYTKNVIDCYYNVKGFLFTMSKSMNPTLAIQLLRMTI